MGIISAYMDNFTVTMPITFVLITVFGLFFAIKSVLKRKTSLGDTLLNVSIFFSLSGIALLTGIIFISIFCI